MELIHRAASVLRRRRARNWLAWFFICLLLGGFILLTSEVREALAGERELIGAIDRLLLALAIEHRTPALNAIAFDLTALGSGAALSILTLFLCALLLLKRKPRLATQFLLAAGGAGVLTAALKSYFERTRPDVSLQLVEAQGFSYPSGHSLASAAAYFTCAIFVARQFPHFVARSAAWAFFLGLIGAIGLTRIYLGVHFFSDVAAGILIGFAWASLVELVMDRSEGLP